MSFERVLATTDLVYDAVAGTTPWQAVGSSLAAMVNARSASVMVHAQGTAEAELLCHPNIPFEAVADYAGHYRKHDIWTSRAAAQIQRPGAVPRVWSSGHLVSDSEFLRSEFWNGFGRRYGLRYVLGTVVPTGAAGTMPVGLHRPTGAAPFDDVDRRLLEAVLPHFRRALQLRHRLAAVPENGAAGIPLGLAALDAMASGVLVVDADLRVDLCNLTAERMAAEGLGFWLRREHGRVPPRTVLRPCQRVDAAALTRLVRGTALAGEAGGALRLRAENGDVTTAVLVTPLPARLATTPLSIGGRVPGQALILLRHLAEQTVPRAEILRALFGLSSAEAEVARALAGGASKMAVAAARGLRETTVRTQVRAVLAKTGATNLRDLERILGGLTGL